MWAMNADRVTGNLYALIIRRYQIAAGRIARGLVIIRIPTLLTHAC